MQKMIIVVVTWIVLLTTSTAYAESLYITDKISIAVYPGKDKSSESFLQWFVDEQVEEEASADDIIQQIKLAGETGPGLFMIDRELAQRVFTPPAAAGE